MRLRKNTFILAVSGSIALAACAHAGAQAPVPGREAGEAAVRQVAPAGPVAIVAVPTPLPLPGQLKALAASRARRDSRDPKGRIGAANAAARVQPVRDGFLNAIQNYPWAEGALYQLYASPGQVTDIALQEGEQLVGAGPVAAGDTVRWIIGDTTSGSGAATRVHILVKPTRSDLVTNMVINTDRRTYHLELRATPATYMASVSWSYPQDRLIALRGETEARAKAAPVAAGIDLSALSFDYEIAGDHVAWRPVRAFDDGQQLFIEFPRDIAHGDMPPLFVIGASGAELVNYRVRDRYMIVDQLFAVAELRLGAGKKQAVVRISRTDGRRVKARS
ncbi:P-type conjugative transfer protein TrbG [Sphingomonas sp. AR_OL41]|uniref:P-type conjugative transfer protein TrbG n=1 Tax=Sphingomonas sp. AR_OL41 TaxID=3042729 RepID=UPI00247FC387|nr:P-type conjugative transfer protein TrbG [Sphingomonas sp. AR_OL41]MDH7976123.1 P-type conjugative transfer protein TrbG [Sphingomonas sp. AR_OL41]